PAEGERPDRGNPATEDEPRDAGPDQRLLLMAAQLRTPVGDPDDLHPELLERCPQLLTVALDRRPDLVGRAGGLRHQRSTSDLTVSRIFLASSMAIAGVGAPTLSLRHANRNTTIVSASRTANTIRKPAHRLPVASLIAHATASNP